MALQVTGCDDVTTVGCPLMIALELLIRYEMHGCVIGFEVVWHRHDLFADTILLGLIGNDIHDAFVRRRLRKALPLTRTSLIDRRLRRNRVLHTALDTSNLANSIRVAL